jgi:hypothetical protein
MQKTIAVRVVPLVALAFALTFGLAAPARADVLYGLSSSTPGSLYTINTSTAEATHVADLNGSLSSNFVDLAALNGQLYGTDIIAASGPLAGQPTWGTINPTTGAYTAINNQGGSGNWQSLASNPAANLFYTVDITNGDHLHSVTPGGVITDIGPANQSIRGLAFDSNHNILYGVAGFELYTVNTTTGATTLVGPTGVANIRSGIAYDNATNTLYMNLGDGGGGDSLYTLNTITGAATLVGANGVADFGIDGITFFSPATTSTPEPASLTLLGTAFAAFGGFHLRRWRRKPADA